VINHKRQELILTTIQIFQIIFEWLRNNLTDGKITDLRHTTTTLLLSAGENIKVVSEQLKRATIAFTLNALH